MPARARLARSIARVAAAALPLAAEPAARRIHGRGSPASPRRAARSPSASACSPSRSAAYALARETSLFAIDRIEVSGGSPQVAAAGARGARVRSSDGLSSGSTAAAVLRAGRGAPDGRHRELRPRLPAHAPHHGRARSGPSPSSTAAPRAGSSRRAGASSERLPATAVPTLPRIWVSRARRCGPGASSRAAGAAAAARAVGLAGSFPARIATASLVNGTLVFHLRSGLELLLGDARRRPAEGRGGRTGAARSCPSGSTYLDVSVPGRPVAGRISAALHHQAQVEVEGMNAQPPIDTERSRIYPAARCC